MRTRVMQNEPGEPPKAAAPAPDQPAPPTNLAGRMGRWSAHHWKTAVFGWLAFVIASFAIITLVLAAVGLYGLISFSVAQQTREIGIRIALGAAPSQVVGPMIRRGLVLALSGVAIGLVGAFFASKVVAQFLFGVTATDPVTIAGVSGLLVVVAMIATWIPSRRALRVDPIVALRAE